MILVDRNAEIVAVLKRLRLRPVCAKCWADLAREDWADHGCFSENP